jgi:hypothetical protein
VLFTKRIQILAQRFKVTDKCDEVTDKTKPNFFHLKLLYTSTESSMI